MMDAKLIRQKYLAYMQAKEHALIERASLVLKEDATTLFTSSGMQPLLPYLLGETHPAGRRLLNSQICLRMQDIEEVGDMSHTTCFEMLGNWSLGDYFKEEQLAWFFDFLIDEVGLAVEQLYVTCFRGSSEHEIAKDEESAQILQRLYRKRGLEAKIIDLKNADLAAQNGMAGGRIFYYDDAENWWSRGGGIEQTPQGDPAGGDCEFFFDFGEQFHDEQKYGQAHPASDSARFLEIGNSVFMQYKRVKEGFAPLKSKNVDFGGGLERIMAAALGEADVFKTDLLYPLIQALEDLTSSRYQDEPTNFRIIADHLRATSWLALDGVTPNNKEQGYVMRRLLRRARLKANELSITASLADSLVPLVCQIYADAYPEFASAQDHILAVVKKEEKTFQQTLRAGLREFEKATKTGSLDGPTLFKLYDTYGFPKELSLEEAHLRDLAIAPAVKADFDRLMREQRQRSQTIAAGEFKSGLAGDEPIIIKYHTATHLMYQALRLVLGGEVTQRGSNITSQRLRFDFSHHAKLTEAQIRAIEDIVNEQIEADQPINWEVMATSEALSQGVLGAFGDKYGEQVKVYTVGGKQGAPYSREICGGPHVQKTSELAEGGKRFKIIKEESNAAGVRRIKAVLA